MPTVAEGLYKLVGIPVIYGIRGPFTGFTAGLRGQKAPVNYHKLARTYPHKGDLVFNEVYIGPLDLLRKFGSVREGGPGMLGYSFPDDSPAQHGYVLAWQLSSATSVVPWILGLGVRKILMR